MKKWEFLPPPFAQQKECDINFTFVMKEISIETLVSSAKLKLFLCTNQKGSSLSIAKIVGGATTGAPKITLKHST
jgi:hypothetical protein